MTNAKSTKRALFTSAFAILICVAMLIGTTFAWFTDTASTGVNKIQAGNLDIEVSFAKEAKNDDGTLKGELTEFKTIEDATDVFDNNALWEPGRKEYVVFKIENKGNLALKYRFNLAVAAQKAGINVYNNPYMLADYLCASAKIDNGPGVVDSGYGNTEFPNVNAFLAKANDLGMAGYDSTATPAEKPLNGINLEGNLKAGEINCVCMAVWMPTTVGNEANAIDSEHAATIDLGINVAATQYTYESDSFDNQYDADAKYPVTDNASLAAALETIGEGETMDIAVGKFALPAATRVADGVVFSGVGIDKTVLKPDAKNYTITDATFKNMTIDGRAKSNFDNYGVIKLVGTNSVLDNVEVIGGGTNTYGHSVRVGENTTIRNSYIHGAFRAIMAYDVKDTLLVENSIIASQCYTINIDGGTGKLVVNNSTLKGWTSYTSTIESATFTDCTFEKNTEVGSYGYNYLRPYTNTTVKNCTFGEDFLIGVVSTGFTITIDDCTFNGATVTAENVKSILDYTPGEYDKIMDCTLIVNGVTVTW